MLEVLLNGLQHHQATVRLDITRVLGMLDETRALDPLRDRFQVEPDESVRAAIAWAGRRVHDAQRAVSLFQRRSRAGESSRRS